ncbi:disease resistance protein RUN1-like [Vicia villosa]|uniref:disease resistance protein RUN1-like n=1 Tax=Vicia villosa TaxID=3911 RepID=UPI00273C4C6E|nr:disease resistance protein RUN1-like [Vicia villosa]
MAMQQYVGSSSSSSSSMVASLKKFDVFISFCGEDTRKTFTSHLYEALHKKVMTFIDFELEKGDEISSALNKAIEGSDASIVIFSKDYASSKWCLNELVKILECKRDRRQIVIPVFYDIEPSDVRNQTGIYKQAFEKHELDLKHNKNKLQKWKDALTEAANLSGWNSQNCGMESNFIKDIVEDVLKRLNRRHPFEVNKELVGIEKKYEKMESLLKIGSKDVKTLVLWGMGGIGKTTLAKHLYAKLCSQFEHHCFIENIREESTKCGLKSVSNKLFSELLELPLNAPYVETPIFINRLAHERSLIVLDDVATIEQAENVNIVNSCLGEGSRVIITTRDMQICSQFDECEIYKFEEMNADESLQLFCQNAFGEKCPKDGYGHLSQEAIRYCRGNPLALKVLGANFRTKKSKKGWESELEKLKKIPNRKIYDVLKLSYDDLDRTQQDIFLDTACISRSLVYYNSLTQKKYLTAVWNACMFYPDSGLEVLLDKTLIFFDDERFISMHNLLKEMGKEIVMTESVKDPGRRSRLWDQKDVYDVLKYNKGTEVVEVIEFNIDQLGDLYLSSDCFKSMTNLRHLHITTKSLDEESRLHILEGLEWLSDKLRHLCWNFFPLESLPSTFCAEWLVQLKMQNSKLKKLWNGIQRLDNLMILDLGFSKDLIEIPDLSRAPNLQVVSLSFCESLSQLHPSIFSIPKLIELHLDGCKKIKSLKNNIHLKSLKLLDLSFSSYLTECSPLMSCNRKLTGLQLTGCTQINTSSFWLILDGTPFLKELYLSRCCNLETLPDNIKNNSMLEILILNECSKLKSIPKLPASLQTLELNECRKLKSLPKLPVSLQSLKAMNCIHLDTNSIQRSILANLSLSNRNLPTHPWELFFFPGGEVPSEFYFQTTKASIVIPPIPKYGLCGFIICIILFGEAGLTYSGEMFCTIYQQTKEIDLHRMQCSTGFISDHVLLAYISCYNSDWVKVGSESGSDDYNLSFKFNYEKGRGMRTEWIKSCGVIPVYDLKHSFVLDRRTSGVEIVEIQSNTQLSDDSDDINEIQSNTQLSDDSDEIVEIQSYAQLSDDSDDIQVFDDCQQHSKFDINESQHQEIGAENEDDQQQLIIPQIENTEELNDTSPCSCSIGLLLKHILEESKRLFLKQR